jgi:hypothetical protein
MEVADMEKNISKGHDQTAVEVVPFGLQFLENRLPVPKTPVEDWEWSPEKEIGELVASRNTTEMSGPNSGEDRDEIGW